MLLLIIPHQMMVDKYLVVPECTQVQTDTHTAPITLIKDPVQNLTMNSHLIKCQIMITHKEISTILRIVSVHAYN